jgi:Tfp pilus assembly PilM family ATPase
VQKAETSTEESSLKDLQKRLASIQKAKTNLSESDSDLLALRNREYDNIINEISRMVEFFKSRKYGTFVDQIYLFGGGAYLSSFTNLVEEALDVKCEILPNKAYTHLLDKENYELMIPSIGACLGGRS